MKLFISGPMTGIKHLNLPMFSLVSGALVDLGHNVFSPPTTCGRTRNTRHVLASAWTGSAVKPRGS